MPEEIGLFEAIRTTRAMRRLKPDPVPDELIHQVIAAGVCAPSGGDVQHWRFIVVRDPEMKRQIQQHYKKALDQVLPRYRANPPAPGKTEQQKNRMMDAVVYLAEHLHEAPVLIVCCLVGDVSLATGFPKISGASIYPAVQTHAPRRACAWAWRHPDHAAFNVREGSECTPRYAGHCRDLCPSFPSATRSANSARSHGSQSKLLTFQTAGGRSWAVETHNPVRSEHEEKAGDTPAARPPLAVVYCATDLHP